MMRLSIPLQILKLQTKVFGGRSKKKRNRGYWRLHVKWYREGRLYTNHAFTAKLFSSVTSTTILNKVFDLISIELSCLSVHAGINDLTNGVNLLESEKEKSI